ncbi:MAG: hypothetical protein QOF58_476 [Pseudonocardiales bacterium]|nr:hypothetical protein [Pseudonocardiales bacterium]
MSVVRPLHGLGTAATAAIAVTAGLQVVTAIVLWMSVNESAAALVDVAVLWVNALAAVLFVAWMHRARLNSDVITSAHQHRYKNMWVVLGWFIPFGNLVIPFVVMQDIWRGSDRTQPMVGLQQREKSGLVTAWWLCYIGSNGLAVVAAKSAWEDYALVFTLSAALAVVAAMLAAQMIKQVNAMQIAVPSHLGEA